MSGSLLVLFMVIIGAVIGGITNAIAILMLFRPYRSLYIGKWHIPFTPGLIPKRRKEIAFQLGKMVSDHLVTPQSIQKKFQDPQFLQDMTSLVQQEAKRLFTSEKTIKEWMELAGVQDLEKRLERYLKKKMEKTIVEMGNSYSSQTIKDVLSPETIRKLEEKLPDVSAYILQHAMNYFSSSDGKQRVKKMLDDFLAERGMMGSMLQMLLGNSSIVDKILPEMMKFLRNPGTNEILLSIIRAEFEKMLEWKWERILSEWLDKNTVEKGTEFIVHQFNTETFFQKTLSDLLNSYEEEILKQYIPRLVEKAAPFFSNRIQTIIEKLRIADIVREEVESFSLERIEKMVIEIANKELKAITYLGALLGGVIGLLQGFVTLLVP
ncbi:DUF445 domain-containing protein [Bacillus smithii]|uniref:Uncharacterized protein n=1 Tax=Bacillus smithii 7_3_47FAA TaxID=665952 RepID=G9QIU3_9BACI|nr:DUF445 family protein [Bacillus smithii]EHL78918.1 hypothetical protein HMPREF1015_02104 [Bacillus smithii 7_3_47FAA]